MHPAPRTSPSVAIGGRLVGPAEPCYIVAELSANHLGDLDRALRIIDAAKAAGADAVKLQTYRPDTMTLDAPLPHFEIGGGTPWDGRSLFELYAEARTPWDWHPRLAEHARQQGLDLFSTPFDETAVDFLEELGVPCYKVASFELVHLPLLRKIAATGKPIVMSTGMATLGEVEEAVATVRAAGNDALVLLKCTSAYPAPPSEANLLTLPHLAVTFGVPAGLSDHTMGHAVAVAARALGACIIEKHLTLSRDDGGPDSAFSLEPAELRALVTSVREVEQALGGVRYGVTAQQAASRALRRSIFVVRDIRAGEALSSNNLAVLRPADGLPPRHWDEVLGARAAVDIPRGTPLAWRHVAHGPSS